MDPKPIRRNGRDSRGRPGEGTDEVSRRLAATERRLQQVERALNAVAGLSGNVGVGNACTRCERSLLVVADSAVYCPACGYRRSL